MASLSVVRQLDLMNAMHLRSNIVSKLSPTARKFDYVVDSFHTAAGGSINPKSTYVTRKRYRIHNHRVKSDVPADKLLVYNVKEGWKPLCDFLECEIPTVAFPHENVKGEITQTIPFTRYGQQVKSEVQRYCILCIGAFLVITIAAFLAICLNR